MCHAVLRVTRYPMHHLLPSKLPGSLCLVPFSYCVFYSCFVLFLLLSTCLTTEYRLSPSCPKHKVLGILAAASQVHTR